MNYSEYIVYIDESGDHGLTNINPDRPSEHKLPMLKGNEKNELGLWINTANDLLASIERNTHLRREAENSLLRMSQYDFLTGLPNRRLMQDRLQQLLGQARRPGQAGAVGEHLKDMGVTVAEVSNAMEGIYSQSQIVAATVTDPAAAELARRLGGLPVTANDNVEPGSIIVVVADDYRGPAAVTSAAATTTEAPVGTPGDDFGTAKVSPEIDAGGDGPRCVN